MSHDPIRNLIERQRALWKKDPLLVDAQLYLLSGSHSFELEASKVAGAPVLDEFQLKALLDMSSEESEGELGFPLEISDRQAVIFPLRQDNEIRGLWVLFPDAGDNDTSYWMRDASRFSTELSALRQASSGNPPTFGELVEAIPNYDAGVPPEAPPPLHWERSQARVSVEVEDELSACLLVDHLPIF